MGLKRVSSIIKIKNARTNGLKEYAIATPICPPPISIKICVLRINIKGDKNKNLLLGIMVLSKNQEEKNDRITNGQNHINLSMTKKERLRYLDSMAEVARK